MREKRNVIAGIYKYVKPYRLPLFVGIAIYSAQGFFGSLLSSIFMNLFSGAILSESANDVWQSLLWIVGILLVYSVLVGFGVRLYVKNSELVTRDIKNMLFRSFITYGTETGKSSGEGISEINTEADLTENLYSGAMCEFLSCIITILLSAVIIFGISALLGLLSLSIGAVVFFLQFRLGKPMEKIAVDRLEENRKSASAVANLFSGATSIRLFQMQDREAHRFESISKKMLLLSYRETNIQMLLFALTTVQGWVTVAGVFSLGSYLVVSGDLTLPAMLMVPSLCIALVSSISQVGAAWTNLQAPLAAGERVCATLADSSGDPSRMEDCEAADRDAHGEASVDGDNTLTVKDLTFFYPGGSKPALRNISLTIAPNETVAFIGESGSGKSTLLRVLSGIYLREDMNIHIGNRAFSCRQAAGWRSGFAFVDQSCTLFHMSIRENIALGKENATGQEICHAAKEAMADDFIQLLPQGYDTNCGERGSSLSGGQKQRIAIARALVRNAQFLVLDEITSALDSESEKQVLKTIHRLRRKHTILFTTHNLRQAVSADRIVVIRNGEIVEQGSHEELMLLHGEYERLWRRAS